MMYDQHPSAGTMHIELEAASATFEGPGECGQGILPALARSAAMGDDLWDAGNHCATT